MSWEFISSNDEFYKNECEGALKSTSHILLQCLLLGTYTCQNIYFLGNIFKRTAMAIQLFTEAQINKCKRNEASILGWTSGHSCTSKQFMNDTYFRNTRTSRIIELCFEPLHDLVSVFQSVVICLRRHSVAFRLHSLNKRTQTNYLKKYNDRFKWLHFT